MKVYVPTAGGFYILPGSAIVARETQRDPGRIHVYYEGDKYERGIGFKEKVQLAAGRCLERYPTIAQAHLPEEHLLEIGEFDWERGELKVTNQEALDAWLNS